MFKRREPFLVSDPALQHTEQHIRRIVDALPPPPRSLQRRIEMRFAAHEARRPLGRVRPLLWSAAAAVLILALVWSALPGGKAAWAAVLSALKLGQITVETAEITPTATGQAGRAIREPLPDLLAVELTMGRAPAVPHTLPAGDALQSIYAVSYPDLPAWISQPFYVELCYGTEQDDTSFCLREYRLLFREYGGISSLRPPDDTLIERVDVGGVQGALLTVESPARLYLVVWERDGLMLELQSSRLSSDELLQIAQTVR